MTGNPLELPTKRSVMNNNPFSHAKDRMKVELSLLNQAGNLALSLRVVATRNMPTMRAAANMIVMPMPSPECGGSMCMSSILQNEVDRARRNGAGMEIPATVIDRRYRRN